MKMTMRILMLAVLTMCGAMKISAQFSMTGELRPRTEIWSGSKDSLSVVDQAKDVYTTQRTRLNFNYKSDAYTMKVVVQDVRTYGGFSTMSSGAANKLDLHEAWAEIKLLDDLSFKVGRQELVYDDHRIMGNVGWAQQARSHDVGLLKYEGKLKAHLGFAYNSNNTVPGSYESMQYLWLNKKLEKVNLSGLVLHVDGLTTAGGRAVFKTDAINVSANVFSQSKNTSDLGGMLIGFDGNYTLGNGLTLGVGYESQTGSDSATLAFNPVFGTNHKFNGNLDYFYVGNHKGSVGLEDMYVTIMYPYNDFKFILKMHSFSAMTDMGVNDGDLGQEMDFAVKYKVNKEVTFAMGYNAYLATESMISLKGGDLNENNNQTWFMLILKPKFL